MHRIILAATLLVLASSLTTRATRQQETQSRRDEVTKRGDHVMGFSHEAATHHFRLFKDGGEIEVTANDPNDTATIEQIRMHLGHIARMFASGDFNAPMLIHNTNPPGVATMARLKESIKYEISTIDRGAQIRILTNGSPSTDAVHAFLLFQIIDHQTGDSPTISE